MKKNTGFGLFDNEIVTKDMGIFSWHYPSVNWYRYNIYSGSYLNEEDNIFISEFISENDGLRLMSGEPIVFVFDDVSDISSNDDL